MFYALSETWLREHKDAEVKIDGYQIFRSDKVGSKRKYGRESGGVAIYVRDDVAPTFHTELKFSNGAVDFLAIQSDVHKLYLCCVYRQPENQNNNSDTSKLREALHTLSKNLEQFANNNIILCGDFNLPHAFTKKNMTPSSKLELDMIALLKNFADNHFLQQTIDFPTHVKGNTLDLLFTNNNSMFHEINFIQPLRSITDHYIVTVATKLNN